MTFGHDTCPAKGSFLELLWQHLWFRADCWAQQEMANYGGGDPQPPLIRLNSTCINCSSQLHLTIDHNLQLLKVQFTPGADPERPVYFRRARSYMRPTGADEYNAGYTGEGEYDFGFTFGGGPHDDET